jgi:hypothetical protein
LGKRGEGDFLLFHLSLILIIRPKFIIGDLIEYSENKKKKQKEIIGGKQKCC